jgi:hypothetical protein
MKIVFVMRHPGLLRNFESTVRGLAQNGHKVHLLFQRNSKLGDGRQLADLERDWPGVTHELGARRPETRTLRVARTLRAWRDYLRYLTPEYRAADTLRARVGERVPAALLRFFALPIGRNRLGLALQEALLALFERFLPSDPWVRRQLAVQSPDLVLVSPLVDLGTDQVDYLKAARGLGLPTGLCVHSWDNLTNKGLIHRAPDRVFVWNVFQKEEAVRLHRVPAASVVVTGAPVYDQWFTKQPSLTRAAFCSRVGLASRGPFFLYLGSSRFITGDERAFVERWLTALRRCGDPRLRAAGVLIRPHPFNAQPWRNADLTRHGDVAVWPREGASPIDAQSRADYFDSMYHCTAAIGINTSAQIEAGIVGRSVYTVRVPDFAQDNTLHFRYLVEACGGLVSVADTFEDHFRQLAGALEPSPEAAERVRRFVAGFVRPRGLSEPSTPQLVSAIEALGRAGHDVASDPVDGRRSYDRPVAAGR